MEDYLLDIGLCLGRARAFLGHNEREARRGEILVPHRPLLRNYPHSLGTCHAVTVPEVLRLVAFVSQLLVAVENRAGCNLHKGFIRYSPFLRSHLLPDIPFSGPRNGQPGHGRSSIGSQLMSALASPIKTLVRRLIGDVSYQQARVTLLREPGSVGLDWRWGNSLRRVHPIRRDFGWQSGRPIDRYYTEDRFLPAHQADIRGRVLEIGDDRYTRQFGGERVTTSEILNVNPDMGGTTIQADLTDAKHIPPNTYDCVILTFTLEFIFDVPAALKTLERILRPGGVVLVIVPGISQIARYDMDNWGEFWRFTSLSSRRLFEQVFRAEDITITTYGNVLSSLASLHGLHSTELTKAELDHWDRDYELVIGIRATKRPDSRTRA